MKVERDLDEMVALSVDRIRQFVGMVRHIGVPIVCSFSGGKDSIVLKQMCQLADVGCEYVYNQVGLDPPELVQFIKQHHPDVERRLPKEPFFHMLMRKRWPPTRVQRWCCELLKETRTAGLYILGIRWDESNRRANRLMFETCRTRANTYFLSPIIDWTGDEVWTYIRREKLPYCSLYDEGMKRLGCILCPMAGAKRRAEEARRWPKFVHSFKVAFGRLLRVRTEAGLQTDRVNTAQELYDWWMESYKLVAPATEPEVDEEPAQCMKFDN